MKTPRGFHGNPSRCGQRLRSKAPLTPPKTPLLPPASPLGASLRARSLVNHAAAPAWTRPQEQLPAYSTPPDRHRLVRTLNHADSFLARCARNACPAPATLQAPQPLAAK